MLSLDLLLFDLIFPADAQPTPEALIEGLGGPEVAKTRVVLDPDLDLPQYEMEISPTVPLRGRGERRLLVLDETGGPLRKNPRGEPIVARDLRPERDRLASLVAMTGARLGRMGALGSWGDAAIVARSARDLRALALLPWVLDPTTDIDGRRRANQLSQREFETKIAAYALRLDELTDEVVLGRVPPATLTKAGDLLVVDVLSDRDGSWDVRKSYELDRRLGAYELFARIPGARVTPDPADEAQAVPAASPTAATKDTEPVAAPGPAPEPPRPAGPPIRGQEIGGRVVLAVPAERFDLDGITALGRKNLDILRSGDAVSGKLRDRAYQEGCGFVAPLAYLSEVFLEGKPLDRKRFEAEAQEVAAGIKALEAHLPRFGPVRVLETGGRRYVTSELALDPAALVAAIGAG